MPRRGGRSARRRRNRRRRTNARGRQSIYGPSVPFTMPYHGTFHIDKELMGSIKGHHLAFGNKQILTDQYAFLGAFKEFKLLSCDIRVHWSTYRLSSWTAQAESDQTCSCVAFITDYELDMSSLTVVSFDNLCETYGARFCQVTPYKLAVSKLCWKPTEPSDRDWRSTANDGAFHLYMFWRSEDMVSSHHAVNASVRVMTKCLFRVLSPASSVDLRRVSGLTPSTSAPSRQPDNRLQSPTSEVIGNFEVIQLNPDDGCT